MKKTAAMILALALVGCPKKAPTDEKASAEPSAQPSSAPAPDAGAMMKATADASSSAASSWTVKYSLTPGPLYVGEADKAAVKFKNDESKLLGDGELSLTIDPSGIVSGSSEGGPLGVSVIEGKSEAGTVTATIRRKDPADEGLTGTLIAKLSGDTLEGTMKLAEFNAAIVREAKLQAKKK